MSYRFTLFLGSLLVSTALLSQPSAREQKIEALERQRFDAMTKQDTALLRKLLADDLTYLHSNGLLETKEEHLTNIGTGKLVYVTMKPVEMRVRHYGKSAIVTGIVQVGGQLNGKSFDIKLRYTDVYQKKKGSWQLAAWQSQKIE